MTQKKKPYVDTQNIKRKEFKQLHINFSIPMMTRRKKLKTKQHKTKQNKSKNVLGQ